jgi:hypothetical protein
VTSSPRRFCNPKLTFFGKAGHPRTTAGDPHFIKCVGVVFRDQKLHCRWTFRMYHAVDNWPAMDIWTREEATPRKGGHRYTLTGYGNQARVEEAEVPPEVDAFARAFLVTQRLKGRVYA